MSQKLKKWLTSKTSAYSLEPIEWKVPVAYGSNSVSDLASSIDVATNGVNGRIGNKWVKMEILPSDRN